MGLNWKNILIRKHESNNTLWISGNYLCSQFNSDFSTYLRKFARPNYKASVPPCHRNRDILPITGKSWRYARINGQFYYDYDYIPDRKDTRYRSRLGERDTLIQQAYESSIENKDAFKKEIAKEIEQYVTYRIDNRDIHYFMYYRVGDVCKYNHQKARELAEAISWARCIKHLIETEEYKDFQIETQAEFYEACALILHRKKLEGFAVTTGESLRKKLHYFPKNEDAQYEFFVSKRYGNDNARKLGKAKVVDTETGEIYQIDIHQALILDLWMNPGRSDKGTKQELWEEYKADLLQLDMDIEPLSYSTFCHYTNSYDIRFKTAKERHGADYFNKVYLPYITGKKLVYANSLWCADGSGTIRYKFYEGGELKNRNLYVVMISDVATGKIVGWAVTPPGTSSESPKTLQIAMLNALQRNDRREVMEFVSDNHGAFTCKESKALLESICRHVRTITPHNSQANYAETQFRLFKKRLRRLANWVGSSWNATAIENIANHDYINPDDLPTYGEAIELLEAKIEEWNNTPGTTGISRSQLYAENLHPESQEISPVIWRKVSGNFSMREITQQRGTIVLEKKGIRYKFDIPDYEVLGEVVQGYFGYANLVKTHIYWDAECADVYTTDGQYMFTCYKTPEAAVSKAEADPLSTHAFEQGMAKKVHSTKKVDSFKEEVTAVSSVLYSEIEAIPDHYGTACKRGGKVKETYNEVREAAMEKRLSKKRPTKPTHSKSEEEQALYAEHMRKRELLYKRS